MKMSRSASALLVSLEAVSACTTIVVGKNASADGSVLLSHSDDGGTDTDARLCYVPPRNHSEGTHKPIYWATEDFPRFIGTDRGDCYLPQEGETPYEPIGTVPEVVHTYGYFEATFGLINEMGVGIGESTCSGVFGTKARGHGGRALFSIDALSRLALERSATARDAVKTMGAAAEEHGFYGEDQSFEGSAESLLVGDAEEAFMFHILPDPTGTSAIWAARRVPDDEVGVVANMFVIREIDFEDSYNFLFSDSVRDVALDRDWWFPGQPLDFTAIYSDGEYAHKFYSGRRVWGAFRLMGADFADEYADLRYNATYPPTAKPGKPVSVENLFAIHRDHYEGTKYDMTQGLAAGPWGDPDRWSGQSSVKGHWERSIGLFRTGQTHVVQARKAEEGVGTILWYGPHSADSTVFLPIPAGATMVPDSYSNMNPKILDRSTAYWAHRYVFNIAKIKYNHAMSDVRRVQEFLENAGKDLVAALDAEARAGQADASLLNEEVNYLAVRVLDSFWALPDLIVAKYADGWLQDGDALGYPDWWLKAVGYESGPPPPPSALSSAQVPSDTVQMGDVESCIRACPYGADFVACMRQCEDASRSAIV